MPFKIDRFEKHFFDVIKKEATNVLGMDLNEYNKLTSPVQKVKYIRGVFEEISKRISPSEAESIMQRCGKNCIGTSTIAIAKSLYKEAKDFSDFLLKLNETGIGGGHLKFENGVILASYKKCYCGSVNKTKEKISLAYCYCSAGWYKRLFEEVLSRSVRVDLLQSIINGADQCLFKIHINDD